MKSPSDHALLLVEIRAALSAGAAPRAALLAGIERDKEAGKFLASVGQTIRLGGSLAEAVAHLPACPPMLDLLVRALAVAEATGCGGLAAVDQALTAADDEVATRQRLQIRTSQARGTATLLTILPAGAWVLFVILDPGLLRFYGTTFGLVAGVVAVALSLAGWAWARRLVNKAAAAAEAADPLAPQPRPPDLARGAVLAIVALLVFGAGVGWGAGVVAAALGFVLGGRRPAAGEPPVDLGQGGAAETVELVAVALSSGLAVIAALAAVTPLAPSAGRGPLTEGVRRLRSGELMDRAFSGAGLASLGAVLAASERWGAPAVPDLRLLASRLRSARRAAAEEAAERAQLSLVFPTTLLTLPAFMAGVVPPLLWAAFSGAGG